MPQPLNARRGEQWQSCERCGRLFPMSSLVKQKGLLICTQNCFDDLTVERRPYLIEQILNPGGATEQEGMDMREVDRGFFEGFDDLTR